MDMIMTKFPGQVRPLILLCRLVKPYAVFSVQVLLGLLIGFAASYVSWFGSLVGQAKDVISDEWVYELDSLPGHSRRSSSNANKAFCHLDSC